MVLAPLSAVVISSTRQHEENDTMNRIAERCRVALYRVAGELRGCQSATVLIKGNNSEIEFTEADSYSGGSIVSGDVRCSADDLRMG